MKQFIIPIQRIFLLTIVSLFFSFFCFNNNSYCQQLEVISQNNIPATFRGLSPLFIDIFEDGIYRGYIGSFSGSAADVDFGTGATNDDGKLHFTIKANPKLTIDTDGDVGIGNQSPAVDLVIHQRQAANANSDALVQNPSGVLIEAPDDSGTLLYVDISNDLNFAFGSGTIVTQRAYIDNTNGDYYNSSDINLKKNIHPLQSVLDGVLRLKPQWYTFKNSTSEIPTLGFIAQDVQKIFPQLVNSKNESLALAYDKFAVLAIKAIQEQNKIISKLTERITALESTSGKYK